MTLDASAPGARWAPRTRASWSVRSGLSSFLVLSGVTSGLLLLYTVVAARRLPDLEYGRFAALFSVVVLSGVVFAALQAHVATLVAGTRAGGSEAVPAVAWRAVGTWMVGAVLVSAGGVPVLTHVLDTSLSSSVATATIACQTMGFAGFLGLLQGGERFGALGAANAFQSAARLLAAVVAPASVEGVLWATALSMVPSLVLIVAMVRPWVRPTTSDRAPAGSRAGAALLASLAAGYLTVGDVILSRVVLSPHEAATVAAASIPGRVLVFFGAMVAVVALPRIVRASADGWRVSLTASGVIAAVVVPATIVMCAFTDSVMRVATGAEPFAPATICIYVAAAAVFSVSVPTLYLALASGRRWELSAIALPPLAIGVLGSLAATEAHSHAAAMLAAAAASAVCSGVYVVRARGRR